MILPMALPPPPPVTQSSAFAPVETRLNEASLAIIKVSGLWLLLDSGCPQTLVREDKISADGTLTLPGSNIEHRPIRLPARQLERPSRLLGADGILGNDALSKLGVLIDYEGRKVYMRDSRRASLSGALTAAGRDSEGETTKISIERDSEGWYRTDSVPGGDGQGGAVWDTGATSYAIGRSREELGPRLGFVDVQGFERDTRRPIHLARVTLPGTEPIPILGFRLIERREPATIGPYALTREWTYLDEARGLAVVPKPTPRRAAERALASLLQVRVLPRRIFDRPTHETVNAIAAVHDDEGLDRARQTALRLVRDRD